MAMRELNARLRVAGLSDDEAAQLPMRIDAEALNAIEISTWRTDAGDLDVLVDIPGRDGTHRRYEDLVTNAHALDSAGFAVRVAGLADIIASKEWANRPKDREALPELDDLPAVLSDGHSPWVARYSQPDDRARRARHRCVSMSTDGSVACGRRPSPSRLGDAEAELHTLGADFAHEPAASRRSFGTR